MSQTIEHLLALQKLHFQTKPLLVAEEARIRALREKVPLPILTHFDRLIVRGKKGVAIARGGVCSECHLLISSGTLASLAYACEIHTCENCGRYLYLPEDEPLGLTDPGPLIKPSGKSEARPAPKKKTRAIALQIPAR